MNENFTIVGGITLSDSCVTLSVGNENNKTLCKDLKDSKLKMKSEFITLVYNRSSLKVYFPDPDKELIEIKIEKISSLKFKGTTILSGFKLFRGCLKYNDQYSEYVSSKKSKKIKHL